LFGSAANLKRPSGVAFVAAKTYYFGVGGSVNDFIDLVRLDNVFSIETCAEYTMGVNRCILRLAYKADIESS
jgi:hypothetical protein